MPIPKIIHQTARSFDSLPQDFKDNIARLRALNPDWIYKFYDDAEIKKYIEQNLSPADWSEVEQVNPKYGVVFADLFRYLVIYNEGGVYLDVKSTAKRPLSEVVKPEFTYVISQWPNKLGQRFQGSGLHPELVRVPGGEFQQWHVIAAPKHPFLKAAIEQAIYNIRTYTPKAFGISGMGVLRLSGPICYTQAIWPLLDHYPSNIVEIDDLGIQYSIYEDIGINHKHEKFPGHYAKVDEPIVLKDVYVDPVPIETTSLGEMLARELRENTDMALKIAVFAIVAVAAVVILFPLGLIWLLLWM